MNKQVKTTLAFVALILLPFHVVAKGPHTEVTEEVTTFLAQYTQELLAHDHGKILERYHPEGVYFTGEGRKMFFSHKQLDQFYRKSWQGPKDMAFKNVSIEVLSDDNAMIAAQLSWTHQDGKTDLFSYAGVLVRTDGHWRIKLEAESRKP